MSFGVCVMRRNGPWLEVERADPVIFLGAFMVAAAEAFPAQGMTLQDGMLEIRGIDRVVRYRLGDWDADLRGYAATLQP